MAPTPIPAYAAEERPWEGSGAGGDVGPVGPSVLVDLGIVDVVVGGLGGGGSYSRQFQHCVLGGCVARG